MNIMNSRDSIRSWCHEDAAASSVRIAVEEAKSRCTALINQIESLSLGNSGRQSKPCVSWKPTLLRLVHSELSFLSRISFSSDEYHTSNSISSPLSINVGHLEAVVHILQQQFITGLSRVCKPVPLSSSSAKNGKQSICPRCVHVDIVCTINGNPVWFIASDRNPKYISWLGSLRNKGLMMRIEQVVDAANSSVAFKPSSIILFFSNGLDDTVCKKIQDEFCATNFEMEFSKFECGFEEELEGEWINIIARSYENACILEIKLLDSEDGASTIEHGMKGSILDAARHHLLVSHELTNQSLGSSFCSILSRVNLFSLNNKDAEHFLPKGYPSESNVINYDTTALIAIISGISNGDTKKILATPECELRSRFKSNYDFVIAQVMSEIENPIHLQLEDVISGKSGIICESVYSEFKELVSMCGGPSEKLRADHLLKHLLVVPDSPSARMMSLPTTRKLALKNKVVFGTGDYWHAPTLTANMAFVRAVSQTGMSLFTIEHGPRALTGD